MFSRRHVRASLRSPALRGTRFLPICGCWRVSSTLAASSCSRATSTRRSRSRISPARRRSSRDELPLWVSTDQEGGRVARLKTPFTVWPPMMTLGRSGDEGLAERFARALAAELRAVGISLDFTPVLDILTNKDNPAIGDRALSERAEDVARLGRAIVRRSRPKASRRAASISPATETRAPTRTTSCRSSSTRPIGSTPWSSCRSRPRSRRASPRS